MSIRTFSPRMAFTLGGLLWAGAALAQPPSAPTTGTASVTGVVTDSVAGAPVANAEVYVVTAPGAASGVGTRGVRTAASGRYTLTGLPAGQTIVRVRLIGYALAARTLTLRDGEAATANFALTTRSTQLDQVVVTGTGGVTQRRAVGNVIETVKAAEVLAVAPARSVDRPGGRAHAGPHRPAGHRTGRHRPAAPRARRQQPVPQQRPAHLHRRRAHGRVGQPGPGPARRRRREPAERRQPRGHREHRGHQGTGRVDALRHRGVQRRHPDHHEARLAPGRRSSTSRRARAPTGSPNPEGRAGTLYGRDAATGQILSFNLYRYEIESGNGPIFTNGRNQGYNAGPQRRHRRERATTSRRRTTTTWASSRGTGTRSSPARANIDVGRRQQAAARRATSRTSATASASRSRRSTSTRSATWCGARRAP